MCERSGRWWAHDKCTLLLWLWNSGSLWTKPNCFTAQPPPPPHTHTSHPFVQILFIREVTHAATMNHFTVRSRTIVQKCGTELRMPEPPQCRRQRVSRPPPPHHRPHPPCTPFYPHPAPHCSFPPPPPATAPEVAEPSSASVFAPCILASSRIPECQSFSLCTRVFLPVNAVFALLVSDCSIVSEPSLCWFTGTRSDVVGTICPEPGDTHLENVERGLLCHAALAAFSFFLFRTVLAMRGSRLVEAPALAHNRTDAKTDGEGPKVERKLCARWRGSGTTKLEGLFLGATVLLVSSWFIV